MERNALQNVDARLSIFPILDNIQQELASQLDVDSLSANFNALSSETYIDESSFTTLEIVKKLNKILMLFGAKEPLVVIVDPDGSVRITSSSSYVEDDGNFLLNSQRVYVDEGSSLVL